LPPRIRSTPQRGSRSLSAAVALSRRSPSWLFSESPALQKSSGLPVAGLRSESQQTRQWGAHMPARLTFPAIGFELLRVQPVPGGQGQISPDASTFQPERFQIPKSRPELAVRIL